jgi:hypothetical protein
MFSDARGEHGNMLSQAGGIEKQSMKFPFGEDLFEEKLDI